jgi:hypothetical protein
MPQQPSRETIIEFIRAEQDHAFKQIKEWQNILDACAIAIQAFGGTLDTKPSAPNGPVGGWRILPEKPGKKTRRKWPTGKPDLSGVLGYLQKSKRGESVKYLCAEFGCDGLTGKNLMARHLSKLKAAKQVRTEGSPRKMLWFADPG